MKITNIFLLSLFPLWLFGADYNVENSAIKDKFFQSLNEYKSGNTERAKELVQEAYFGHFENLEAGIRINLGQKKTYLMEKQFGDIRKAIKSGKDIDTVQVLINNLLSQIDEIMPLIENGTKLVAEKSHDGGLSASNATNSNTISGAENNGNNFISSNTLNKTDSYNKNEEKSINTVKDIENLANFTAQNAANPWNSIYIEISDEFQNAKNFYDTKDRENLIASINKIKFEIYRNKKLEIAVRQYVGQNIDAMIQQILGNIISKNITLSDESFKMHVKDADDLIKIAVSKLPENSYEIAPKNLVENTDYENDDVDFAKVMENIKTQMAEVLELYKNGEIKKAVNLAQDIYFDEYEASGMEVKIGAIDNNLKLETEASFSAIASLVQNNAGIDKIGNAQAKLFDQLEISVEKAGKNSSPINLFLLALTIILREGLEALIIVAAVVAYLIKTQNSNKLGIVYSSVGIAVLLSFFTAWVVNLLFTNAAQSREILEGTTMLIAVILLFYVGFWLLSNAGAKKWNRYIKGKISQSLSKGDKTALWWVSFLAVYREGAETVLFYQALIFDAQKIGATNMIIYGFLLGCIVLAVLFIIFKTFSIKIPLRAFFIATSAIIFYMAIVFTGKGVMELVEGKVFVPTIIHSMPTITWLGIYPYVQSLIPQILMVSALIVGILIIKKREKSI
ncbi:MULTISPECIES: FTR1 family protein [Campylobacter]|uniref:FTR1 family iron permease n=1 Tax=Campylobacter TaxID=194 RepID=UPI0023F38711|nr:MULTISPECIES: FTR1 family protein [Campylobacter]MCI6641406.1 FTR1 family iron permease [Campylobacter sp.]MDD7422537.1 FTR1 family iron permease [Campylobacter hominis]MDY3117188.1 FTR1 family protein [Campylobacter hominis]